MVPRVSNVDRDTDRIKPVDDVGHRSFTLGTSDWHIDSSFRRVRETRAGAPGHHGKIRAACANDGRAAVAGA